MKKILVSLVLTLVMGVFCVAPASAENNLKIGVVDVTRCISESQKGKKLKDELRAKTDEVDKKISDLRDEAKKIAEEAERQQMLQSDAVKAEKRKRFAELQEQASELQKKKRDLSDSISEKTLKLLEKTISKVAEKNGYDMIFTKGNLWLPYANKKVEITDEVISAFDDAKYE